MLRKKTSEIRNKSSGINLAVPLTGAQRCKVALACLTLTRPLWWQRVLRVCKGILHLPHHLINHIVCVCITANAAVTWQ